MQGSVSALWSEYWLSRNGLQRAIDHSHQALDLLPPAGVFERRTAAAYWCFAKQEQGSAEEARETTEALAEFNLMRAGLITTKTRSAQALC